MRAHVIESGKVTNTISINKLSDRPDLDLLDASLGGKMGDLWDGSIFTTPTPVVVVPVSVSRYQMRIALIDASKMAALKVILEDVATDEKVVEYWKNRSRIFRASSEFNFVADALAVTEQQKDNLFVAASLIEEK